MASRHRTRDDDAGRIAAAALAHLSERPDLMERFFALTGLDATNLRAASTTQGFVAGVLDFILQDERLVTEIAAAEGLRPDAILIARQRLDRPTDAEDWPPRSSDEWA